jgi:hypothetical protein
VIDRGFLKVVSWAVVDWVQINGQGGDAERGGTGIAGVAVGRGPFGWVGFGVWLFQLLTPIEACYALHLRFSPSYCVCCWCMMGSQLTRALIARPLGLM